MCNDHYNVCNVFEILYRLYDYDFLLNEYPASSCKTKCSVCVRLHTYADNGEEEHKTDGHVCDAERHG